MFANVIKRTGEYTIIELARSIYENLGFEEDPRLSSSVMLVSKPLMFWEMVAFNREFWDQIRDFVKEKEA